MVNKDGSGHCVIGTVNNSWYSAGTTVSWDKGKIKNNTWHNIFCVYDGSKLNVYIDGQKVRESSRPISGNVATRLFRLRIAYNPYSWTSSKVKDFVLENRALTQQEIPRIN